MKKGPDNMIQIQQYGLQWTVKEKPNQFDDRYVFLKQCSGLVFCGRLNISLLWGPYIFVDSVYLREKYDENNMYVLPTSQWFIAPELEPLCYQFGLFSYIHWYHTLNDGFTFSKKAFKQNRYDDYWRISLTTATGSLEDAEIVADLFHGVQLTTHSPNMYVDILNDKYPFLCVHRDTYKQLPETWTVNNLYSINKESYESYKKRREYLWHSIVEARAQHKPVKITVSRPNTPPVVYTEKAIYGITIPTILPNDNTVSL